MLGVGASITDTGTDREYLQLQNAISHHLHSLLPPFPEYLHGKTYIILTERNRAGGLASYLASLDTLLFSKSNQLCGAKAFRLRFSFLPCSKKEKKKKKVGGKKRESLLLTRSPGEVSRLQRMVTDGQAKLGLVK